MMRRSIAGASRVDGVTKLSDLSKVACFLPSLSGRVERISSDGVLSHNPALEGLLARHLELALDLYETLPTYNAHAILPKLSFALGAAAAYIGNPDLAIGVIGRAL